MTTSESKGRFFYKTNIFESIRITNRIESIRIAKCSSRISMLLMHIHKDRLVGLSRLGCLHTDVPLVDNKPTRAKYRNGAHECIRIYN